VLGASSHQLEVSTESSHPNRYRSLIASSQHHGLSDDGIFDELEVILSYLGLPLSWYEFTELMYDENHDIAVAAKKKKDSEARQATFVAMTEYTKN